VAGFAYDPTSAVLVLVGPVATASGEEDQTWTFDGSTWSQLAPSESPPALSDPCLGYDPATGDLVLFGGFYNDVGSATAQAGTWAWDGTTWSESAPVTSPPGLADAAMAFDPQIGLLVMFGGVTGTIGDNVLSDQTWAWDGANWSQLAVPEHPAPRSFAGLAWDPSSSQMLLSGGGDNYVPGPADTWELGTAPIATPTITSVTAINSGASVTWTAPSLGAGVVIDSYTLTASPGGMSSSVAGDVTSGGVGGPLTNGVAYTITVTPVNQNGTYPSSAPSAPVVPLGAPGSATNVVATAGDQSVELTWTAPAPTSGAAPVSGYTISGAPSGPQTVGADTTSLDITGLTDGTGYLFAVETLSAFGDSEWDAVSQEVTPYGAVGAPTLISALAGSNHDVTVTWAPPAPVAGVAVGGYEVTTSAGGSITVGPTATSADVSGLLLEQIYYFRVFAIASTGTGPPSAWSPPLVLYDLPPGVPGSVRTTSGSGSLTVAWEAPPDGPSPPPGPPAGYIVELSNGASQRVNASATSVVFANLRNGVQYDVKVGAFNQYGYGLPSQLVDGTPYSSVGIPENVDATTEGRAVTLRWSRAARKDDGPVIGYEIRDSAGTTIRVGASEDSAKFSGLSPRSVYSFVVSALTEAGLGPPAETVTIRVPAVPPSAPRELSAADGNKWVRLSWVAPAQNGGDAIADYLITVSVCAPGKSPCEMKVVRTSTVSGTRSTATVGALTNGKRYYFSVAARTQAGESKASATVSARPTA
jgi:titin